MIGGWNFPADLDRVQIIKGWSNKKTGYPEEKIYDIAWSDDCKIDEKTGKLPPMGNTVDVKTAISKRDCRVASGSSQ